MAIIERELFDRQPEKRLMLQAFLQQLFLVIYRLWHKNHTMVKEPDHASSDHFRKFQHRVWEVGTKLSIGQVATELGITPVHLNRICKNISGKSASELVQAFILEEARKYLTYTSYSISEIAYLLNFEYSNYFARFFRKHLGMSPRQFREQLEK